ncbi:MAG: hypothetical protein P8Z30_06855 [Acidobacteriota bacterium]
MKNEKLLTGPTLTVMLVLCSAWALLASQPTPSQGGWVPIVANSTKKIYKLSATGKTLINETAGVYMRDRNGSIYWRDNPAKGLRANTSQVAMLKDRVSGKVYRINYGLKTVTTVQDSLPTDRASRAFYANMIRNHSLGKKTISGVECVGLAVPDAGGGKPAEMWVAPSLNYLLVDLKTFHDNEEYETILTHVQVGKEPGARFFHVPDGFRIISRAAR